MLVTVIFVGMSQMVTKEVVHVIAMRDGLVRAVVTMGVVLVAPSTRMVGGASLRIGRANLEHVFVYMISVRVIQMPMQVVGMAGGRDRQATTRVMLVRVLLMFRTSAHCVLLFECQVGPSQFNSAS